MFRTTAIVAIATLAFSGAALAQENQGGGNQGEQEGLVNVQLGDVVISQIAQDINVDVSQIPATVQVPVDVAATVCGIDAAVLAQHASSGDATCEATSSSDTLAQIVQEQAGTQQ
jgi:hypothetical protein